MSEYLELFIDMMVYLYICLSIAEVLLVISKVLKSEYCLFIDFNCLYWPYIGKH